MKHALALGATALAITGAASARPAATFTFDELPSGSQANSFAQAAALGVSFSYAALLPDLDPSGDPIPGTTHWRPDITAPTVTVSNPLLFNRGPAPSGSNALDALWQPVLISFSTAYNLDANGFSLVADNSRFGLNGLLPGFADIAVQFYDAGNNLLGSSPINQTVPGFTVTTGGFSNVSYILIAAGKFYDNITISGTPVPAPSAFLALLPLAAAAGRRRR